MQLILDHDLEALTIGLVEGYACVRACVCVCVCVCLYCLTLVK
jgi:uncharacterized membrane protein (Fun14 family)